MWTVDQIALPYAEGRGSKASVKAGASTQPASKRGRAKIQKLGRLVREVIRDES